MNTKLIESFYQATKFVHDGNAVYIRRNGELFTRQYVSGASSMTSYVAGHYNEVTLGYWPELADQMWAGTPPLADTTCPTCGKPVQS